MKPELRPVASIPHAKVAAADYARLAVGHIRAIGGQGVVLSERGQPAQWRAWIAYFAWLDADTAPRGHKASTYASLKQITVPTAWPLEFDESAPATPGWEFGALEEKPPTAERRRELADMLRAVVAGVALEDAPRARNWRNMTPQTAEAKLSELTDKYASAPAQVRTSEMAAYLAKIRADEEGPVDDAANVSF